ncbi:MAG TPA: hypothetical protein VFT91_00585 [Dehalococcoidia bacterium]|nr:hypothetical protein [Dehalococcoidia bacterium]
MEDPSEDWLAPLVRDFQDRLTCGLYESIYRLNGNALDSLMRGQAHACVAGFIDLAELPVPLSVDDFLEAMRTAGPSQIQIRREGAVVHWDELHGGECVCPFVRRRVVRLHPKLCICGAHWVKHLFETVTGVPVAVETIETVATGAQSCRFRITLPAG